MSSTYSEFQGERRQSADFIRDVKVSIIVQILLLFLNNVSIIKQQIELFYTNCSNNTLHLCLLHLLLIAQS